MADPSPPERFRWLARTHRYCRRRQTSRDAVSLVLAAVSRRLTCARRHLLPAVFYHTSELLPRSRFCCKANIEQEVLRRVATVLSQFLPNAAVSGEPFVSRTRNRHSVFFCSTLTSFSFSTLRHIVPKSQSFGADLCFRALIVQLRVREAVFQLSALAQRENATRLCPSSPRQSQVASGAHPRISHRTPRRRLTRCPDRLCLETNSRKSNNERRASMRRLSIET